MYRYRYIFRDKTIASFRCHLCADHGAYPETSLNRARALKLLAANKPALARRFGVTRLALFGSIAGDVARTDSDIDILVAFDGPATSARYFGVQFFLEDLFGCGVDLVTEKALRPELRPFVETEAVNV